MHALTVALLLLSAGLYGAGVSRLWRRAGHGEGIGRHEVACFALGWVTIGIALLSPLHHAAERLLWAHMVQHELLMVVAAPLIACGRPLEAFAWALPRGWRGGIHLRRSFADPAMAWCAHAVAIWAWHVPWLFEASVRGEWTHLAQHASFFLSALWFWWTILAAGPRVLGPLLALFTTMLHTGALGALMTLSGFSWYAGYALDDQQLAGLVMWVPAGVVYPVAALLLVAKSLRRCAS